MYRLQERLLNTCQKPNMSVAEYFTRVKSSWDEIDDLRPLPVCTCNPTNNFLKIQQDQRIMTFLMKLDPQFNQVRYSLLMHKDLPDVAEVYRMLSQEESHKDLSKPMAFASDKWKSSLNNKNTNNGKKLSYFCDHCKVSGHSFYRCFKIHSYPNKNQNQLHQEVCSRTSHRASTR